MANTNRFYKPIGTVQLGSPTELPFEQMMKTMGHHQQRYDVIQNAAQDMADREFDAMSADTQGAAAIMDKQLTLQEEVMGLGDLSRNAQEATGKLTKFARENYGKYGKATAIQGSYNNLQETIKNIRGSDIPEAQKEATISRLVSQYKGVGNGTSAGYGKKTYNKFGVHNVPGYVDLQEETMKIMKEMDPHTLEQEGISFSKDGRWIRTIGGKQVTLSQEELMRVAAPLLRNNPKLQDYLGLEQQNYQYNLENNPTGLAAINKNALEVHGKKTDKFNEYSALVDNAKDVLKTGTIKEKQAEYNKMIDELGLNLTKLKEDGVTGPKTKEGLGQLEAALDSVNLTDPGQFSAYTAESAASDYMEQRFQGTAQSVSDMYDVHDVSKKESIEANPYKLNEQRAAFKWRNIKRKHDLKNTIAAPLTIRTPGAENPNSENSYLAVDKNGKIKISDKHPGIVEAAKDLSPARVAYYKRKAINAAKITAIAAGSYLNPKTAQIKIKALQLETEQLNIKFQEASNIYQAKVDKINYNYRLDFEAFASATDPDDKQTDLEKKQSYEASLKERTTYMGTATKFPDKKEKERVEALAMDGDKMAEMGNFYIIREGQYERITSDMMNDLGGQTAASFHGTINPEHDPSGFNSGYTGSVTFGSGNKKKQYTVVMKSSSVEQDAIGSAAAIGGSLRNSTEQSKIVNMLDKNGDPFASAEAIKSYTSSGSVKIEYKISSELLKYAQGEIQPIEYVNDSAFLTEKAFRELNEILGGVKLTD